MKSLVFELALKDYLFAVTFLVQLPSRTGFVIQRSKEKSTLCKLFGTAQNSFLIGFNGWKHVSEYIGYHERSLNHSSSLKISLQGSTQKDRVNAQPIEMFESKFKYMKNVLHRVVNVVKFLATRGLAFRGSEETFGFQANGNYLGVIELNSQYDAY